MDDEKNYELELYKLITTEEPECGWVNENEFLVWVYTGLLADFVEQLAGIFGSGIYDDGGIEAHIVDAYVVFDIASIAEDGGVDMKRTFPRDKFKH